MKQIKNAAFPERLTNICNEGLLYSPYFSARTYQYKMISSSFVFDTTKIKKELDWQPTLTNEEMLLRSYTYYKENRSEIEQRKDVSAHKKGAKMGIAIKILKFFC